jgi:hypothetical protein
MDYKTYQEQQIKLYKEFKEKQKEMRIKQLTKLLVGDISEESDEDETQPEEKDNLPNNWVDIIHLVKSSNIPPPIFSGSSVNLGNKLLDHALERSARNISDETNIPFREVQARIVSELRSNRVAKGSAISTIRFLREASADLFLVCPECGYENELDWEICKNCNIEK